MNWIKKQVRKILAALVSIGILFLGGNLWMNGKEVPQMPRLNAPHAAYSLEKVQVYSRLMPCLPGDTIILPIVRRRGGVDSLWDYDTLAVKYDCNVQIKSTPNLR